jgi:fructan beta-fructosidase
MWSSIKYLVGWVLIAACGSVNTPVDTPSTTPEPHRPLIHFTPPAKWMNDPNGMVYHNDTYHLMYQYYPDSTVWGPMHWGHASSRDLVHWTHQPIALYPDSLGYIFSGSAVVDVHNTSGFGKEGKVPLVAIFTHHNNQLEKAGSNTFQYQSLAYSLDDGKTWTPYAGNPVLKNPGIRDFRDPKVSWHEATKKWIMTLATMDRITFYSSPNLREWTKESEFGKEYGAHGGVWECPDLFPLEYQGQKVWILLVSINPGGPNGGSATQYFTGQFDGHQFTPFQTDTRWLDYGPDNYAGVTWWGTGSRKIFIGWMSNWQYAQVVPTQTWRSATTIPRDLGLAKIGEKYFVTSRPVSELAALAEKPAVFSDIRPGSFNLTSRIGRHAGAARLHLSADSINSFSISISNEQGQKVVIGYDKDSNQYYIDRRASGKTAFEKGFAARHTAPRLSPSKNLDLTLVLDIASVELFADNGLTVMTQIFFPDAPYSKIAILSPDNFSIKQVAYSKLRPITTSRGAATSTQGSNKIGR